MFFKTEKRVDLKVLQHICLELNKNKIAKSFKNGCTYCMQNTKKINLNTDEIAPFTVKDCQKNINIFNLKK